MFGHLSLVIRRWKCPFLLLPKSRRRACPTTRVADLPGKQNLQGTSYAFSAAKHAVIAVLYHGGRRPATAGCLQRLAYGAFGRSHHMVESLAVFEMTCRWPLTPPQQAPQCQATSCLLSFLLQEMLCRFELGEDLLADFLGDSYRCLCTCE
jgi:hypothetical protein